MEGSMEAASVPSASASSKLVTLGREGIVGVVVGAVIAVVGMFLKAFSVPDGVIYTGSNNVFSATSSGKIILGCVVVALIFLAIAARTHRKGVLWGTYVFSVIAVAIAAILAGGGYTLTRLDGTTLKANAAIGVYVVLVGTVVMFVSAIIARRRATPAA
jgi:hypothetical protein